MCWCEGWDGGGSYRQNNHRKSELKLSCVIPNPSVTVSF